MKKPSDDNNSEFINISKDDFSRLEGMVREIAESTKKNEERLSKFERFILWIKITAFLKFLLIVLPLIFAYLFVAPRLESWIKEYKTIIKPFLS